MLNRIGRVGFALAHQGARDHAIAASKQPAALLLRRPLRTALTVAAALAQIGEFSFILAVMGVSMKLLPPEGQSYIVAGAILSIVVNPLVFRLLARRST